MSLDKQWEEQLRLSSKRLMDSVRSPDAVSLVPPRTVKLRYYRNKIVAVAVIACLLIALLLGTSVTTEPYFYIPGLSVLVQPNYGVTHSIEGRIVAYENGYTDEIVSAYVQGDTLELTAFHYRTENGLAYDAQKNNWVVYSLFYNGEECGVISASYGTPTTASFALPKLPADEEVCLTLCYGAAPWAEFLADLRLIPVKQLNTDRPSDTVNGITVCVDAATTGKYVEFHTSAALPSGTDNECYSIVDNHFHGFAEAEIVFYDTEGKPYPSVFERYGYDEEHEDARLLRLWHRHRFMLPGEIHEGILRISSISMYQKQNGVYVKVTVPGPWEIPVSW